MSTSPEESTERDSKIDRRIYRDIERGIILDRKREDIERIHIPEKFVEKN